ncbi:alpha/beta hydrolase, partial [bacterium LRH843]|nr:alpha/beta hydrolase [bacterium LRH843]
ITNILYAGASQAGNNIRYVTDDSETTKWTHTTSFSENIDDIVDDVKTLMPIK